MKKKEFIEYTSAMIEKVKQTKFVLTPQVQLWRDLSSQDTGKEELILKEVKTEGDWGLMWELRYEVEKNFGAHDRLVSEKMVNEIKKCNEVLPSHWFLAYQNHNLVGEIGIVEFLFNGQKIGRLQDVDILPAYQGQGLGNKLLATMISWSVVHDIKALCLEADQNGWPKSWYLRKGFIEAF